MFRAYRCHAALVIEFRQLRLREARLEVRVRETDRWFEIPAIIRVGEQTRTLKCATIARWFNPVTASAGKS